MSHRFLPIIALCAVLAGPSWAETPLNPWPDEIIDTMDDQRLVVFLDREAIAASPPWMPANGEPPPLTIAQAIAHVEEWMDSDPRYRGATIREIELKPIRRHEQEHRWYYLVQLRHRQGGKRDALYAAVLLDGKVFPALAEPDAIK